MVRQSSQKQTTSPGIRPVLTAQERASLLNDGLAASRAGVSLIPIGKEKRPAGWLLPVKTDDQGQPVAGDNGKPKRTWEPYQNRHATEQELRAWMAKDGVHGLATVCGAISGGLLVLDFDIPRFFDDWKERIGGLPGTIPVQQSGGGGFQVAVRCPNPGRNDQLAWAPDDSEESGRTIAIETRGEGGYAVMPGSLHPAGNRYRLLQGSYNNILSIDQETADRWLQAARELDEVPYAMPDPKNTQTKSEGWIKAAVPGIGSGGNVIAAYNQARTIYEVLAHYGYQRKGNCCIRPGGERPTVTILANKDGVLSSFHHNTNDRLCDGYWHDPFSVFCILDHGSDVKAAVRAAAAGLGVQYERTQRIEQRQGSQQRTQVEQEAPEAEEKQHQSQVKELLSIARTDTTFFHTLEGERYARVKIREHYETLLIGEKGGAFKSWLVKAYLDMNGRPPNDTALSQAVRALNSIARWGDTGKDAVCQGVYTRRAYVGGKIYLDLADDDRTVIEIDAEGWREAKDPPVCFRRPNGVMPLPKPQRGGSLAELKPFLNVSTEADWMLAVSWLVGAMHPTGPYAHLSLYGPQGAAKSSTARTLRKTIDPSTALLDTAPKDEEELAINAKNALIVTLENLSHLPDWLSDALCRLSTGAGKRKRVLYTDDEEAIFNARRPAVMNGITELAKRGDLLQRMILVTLEAIPDDRRREEEELDAAFDAAHPRILGGLLDVVSAALRNRRAVCLPQKPRMADFAKWIVAAEEALGWRKGAWLEAYLANQDASASIPLEASPLFEPIKKLLEKEKKWRGLMKDLLEALEPLAKEADLHARAWPRDPTRLSGDLNRLQPSLQAAGIVFVSRRRGDGRHIWLWEGSVAEDPFSVADGVATTPDPTRNADKSVASVAISTSSTFSKTRKGEVEEVEIAKTQKMPKPATPATPATPGPLPAKEVLDAHRLEIVEWAARRDYAAYPWHGGMLGGTDETWWQVLLEMLTPAQIMRLAEEVCPPPTPTQEPMIDSLPPATRLFYRASAAKYPSLQGEKAIIPQGPKAWRRYVDEHEQDERLLLEVEQAFISQYGDCQKRESGTERRAG